jgi:UDP-2,3-diacylglucosamine pyrophosphatase LpxH
MSNKKYVDTLIISDIHLGSDLFRAEKLEEIIKSYNAKKLILNGDIFDSLNLKRLHTEHWNFLSLIRKVSKKSEVVWIHGNHDSMALELSGLLGVKIYKKHFWKSNHKKFMAIHGHQFDRLSHKNIIISGVATFFYHLIQKIDTKNRILSHFIKRTNKSWLRLSDQVTRGALLYARLNKVDIIFCGHTHIARHEEKNGIEYYNSGSWDAKPSHYIIVDKGNVSLVKVD